MKVDPLLVETADRLLAATCTFDAVEQAEVDGWAPTIWAALAEAGFPWVSVDAGAGGSGGSLADAMAIIRAAGSHAAPVPLAETGALAGWLLSSAGLELPGGAATVLPGLRIDGPRLVGRGTAAWGSVSDRIVGLADGRVVSLRPDQVAITPRTNMAGEPRDEVVVDLDLGDVANAEAPDGVDADALARRGSLTRVVLSAGALATMSRLTVDYANERRQFGKPIAAFQAVQHHLVSTAQCAARASMAADVAVRALAAGDGAFEVAAARLVVDAAAVEATRAAHQTHGAMGVTREYRLHHLSRRLWAWRHEWGPVSEVRRVLGRAVATAGADDLFPLVSR